LKKIEDVLFNIPGDEAEKRLDEFMEARFPFGYKMKFIAERFGVIPRGKTLDARTLENLYLRFKDSPIYKETLREAHMEKLDVASVREILEGVASGKVEVAPMMAGSPSPLARHILEEYANVAELMEATISVGDQLEYMKKSIRARQVKLACMSCGEWSTRKRVRELDERPTCGNCGSSLLAVLRRYHDSDAFLELLARWKKGEPLVEDEKETLTKGRKTADMVLSYGRRAVEALMVRGVGPVTTYQVLSRMHQDEKALYSDLLKAKIQYMKTRQYWAER